MDLEKIRAAFWHDGEIGEDYAAELIKEVDILRAEIAQLSIQVVDRGESFERVTADLAAAQSLRAEAEERGDQWEQAATSLLNRAEKAEGEVERLKLGIQQMRKEDTRPCIGLRYQTVLDNARNGFGPCAIPTKEEK